MYYLTIVIFQCNNNFIFSIFLQSQLAESVMKGTSSVAADKSPVHTDFSDNS